MRAEEKNMVERIMNTETMGYAYEYPYGGAGQQDLNLRPHGPQPCALPSYAIPRNHVFIIPANF